MKVTLCQHFPSLKFNAHEMQRLHHERVYWYLYARRNLPLLQEVARTKLNQHSGYKHKKYWCVAFLSKHDLRSYDVIKFSSLQSNNRSFFQRVLKVLCRQKWQPWSVISSSMVAGSKFKFQKNYRNYLFQLSLILNTLFPLMLSTLTLRIIFHKLRTLCSRNGKHESEWK